MFNDIRQRISRGKISSLDLLRNSEVSFVSVLIDFYSRQTFNDIQSVTNEFIQAYIHATSRLINCYVMDGEIKAAKELLSLNHGIENVSWDVCNLQAEYYTSAALVYYAEGNFQKALRLSIIAFSKGTRKRCHKIKPQGFSQRKRNLKKSVH